MLLNIILIFILEKILLYILNRFLKFFQKGDKKIGLTETTKNNDLVFYDQIDQEKIISEIKNAKKCIYIQVYKFGILDNVKLIEAILNSNVKKKEIYTHILHYHDIDIVLKHKFNKANVKLNYGFIHDKLIIIDNKIYILTGNLEKIDYEKKTICKTIGKFNEEMAYIDYMIEIKLNVDLYDEIVMRDNFVYNEDDDFYLINNFNGISNIQNIIKILLEAEKEIIIFPGYFAFLIPSDIIKILQFIKTEKKIKITFVINGYYDKICFSFLEHIYVKYFLNFYTDLYIYPGCLHLKLIITDKNAIFSSFNFNCVSEFINTETSLIIPSKLKIYEVIKEQTKELLKRSTKVSYLRIPTPF